MGLRCGCRAGPHVQFALDGHERVRVQQLKIVLDSDTQFVRRAVSVRV